MSFFLISSDSVCSEKDSCGLEYLTAMNCGNLFYGSLFWYCFSEEVSVLKRTFILRNIKLLFAAEIYLGRSGFSMNSNITCLEGRSHSLEYLDVRGEGSQSFTLCDLSESTYFWKNSYSLEYQAVISFERELTAYFSVKQPSYCRFGRTLQCSQYAWGCFVRLVYEL